MAPRQYLTATNLSTYQHLQCDLYINKVYNENFIPSNKGSKSSETIQTLPTHFQTGLQWESAIRSSLQTSNLLLQIPSIPVDGPSLLENILADDRDHFFIIGLTFNPPNTSLEPRFKSNGVQPITFGLAKPDFLEISKEGGKIYWTVIDAKASNHPKTSHYIQIYFYTLCLQYILCLPQYHSTHNAGLWLPTKKDNIHIISPSTAEITTISMDLLSASFATIVFRDIPRIVSTPPAHVHWHYNPLCQTCTYEIQCKANVLAKKCLGGIPNISIEDAAALQELISLAKSTSTDKSGNTLTDIEELQTIFNTPSKLDGIANKSPSVVERAKKILFIPPKVGSKSLPPHGPILEAVITTKPQAKQKYSYTCPKQEDIAIIISIIVVDDVPICHITLHSDYILEYAPIPPQPAKTLISTLAELISQIAKVRDETGHPLTCQLYLWSQHEYDILQTHLLNAARSTEATDKEDALICIAAFPHIPEMIYTQYQPCLFPGVVLDTFGQGAHPQQFYRGILERLQHPGIDSIRDFRQSVLNEAQRLRHSKYSTDDHHDLHHNAPRITILNHELEQHLSIPVTGYWNVEHCAKILLPGNERCPTVAEITSAKQNTKTLHRLLDQRHAIYYSVVNAYRKLAVTSNNSSLLLTNALPLPSTLVMICTQYHLRKVFFMQQLEIVARLHRLWKSRIDLCQNPTVLEYVKTSKDNEHVFRIISGNIEAARPSSTFNLYDSLLVQDSDNTMDDPPLELLFDDIGIFHLPFPLRNNDLPHWEQQNPKVKNGLLLVTVLRTYRSNDQSPGTVFVRTWGTADILIPGSRYRFSPRLVDLNVFKVLTTIFEMDLRWKSEQMRPTASIHSNIPFIQFLVDPQSLGPVQNEATDSYVKANRDIRDHRSEMQLTLAALEPSQENAFNALLSSRLCAIWGPPGTGKTYTLTLSLLRLLKVEANLRGPRSSVNAIVALTHSAVHVCHDKLSFLVSIYRSSSLYSSGPPSDWLSNIVVQLIDGTRNNQKPPKDIKKQYVYIGTLYQVRRATNDTDFNVEFLTVVSPQLANLLRGSDIELNCLAVDEASQMTLGTFSLIADFLHTGGRVIVAGDPQQLSPITFAKYSYPGGKTFHGSIFDFILSTQHDQHGDPSVIHQLTENFRLDPILCDVVSVNYPCPLKSKASINSYPGGQRSLLRPADITTSVSQAVQDIIGSLSRSLSDIQNNLPQNVITPPANYNCHNVATGIEAPFGHVSLLFLTANYYSASKRLVTYEDQLKAEATIAVGLLHFLQSPNETSFVATPHRLQRDAVNQIMRLSEEHNTFTSTRNVIVDTIERLQGAEAELVVCLLSAHQSISDAHFLLENKRLNVAFSRAKNLCVIISKDIFGMNPRVLTNEEAMKGFKLLQACYNNAWHAAFALNIDDL